MQTYLDLSMGVGISDEMTGKDCFMRHNWRAKVRPSVYSSNLRRCMSQDASFGTSFSSIRIEPAFVHAAGEILLIFVSSAAYTQWDVMKLAAAFHYLSSVHSFMVGSTYYAVYTRRTSLYWACFRLDLQRKWSRHVVRRILSQRHRCLSNSVLIPRAK